VKIELRARLSGRRARTRLNLKSSYPAQGLPVRDVGAFGWLNASYRDHCSLIKRCVAAALVDV
jgi:hypothetical protein